MGIGSILQAASSFLRAERRNVRQFDVPWRRRLWLYRHGFLSSKDGIWDPTDRTVDRYLSDLASRRLGRLGGHYGVGLRNKLLFHLLVSRTHGDLLPAVCGLIRDGHFVGTGAVGGLASVDELAARLAETRLVVKPVSAEKGDGVRVLDGRTGEFEVDGVRRPWESLPATLASDRDLLVTEYVQQADYARTVFPGATNTLRILTMIDHETGEPFVASAVHRFGTTASAPIDNWVAGGVSARVDSKTGELGQTVRHAAGDDAPTWHKRHPETGVPIAGSVVPEWDRIEKTVLGLARTYGSLWPHVGWDVVVEDESATISVLEGELRSAGTDQQAHAPLLADDRVRRFYAHHGVIDSDGPEGTR